MKPGETIRHLEVRNLAALGLCCCLAIFIGVMLTGELLSHSRMEKERTKSLEEDLEKRVSSVGYFFSERLGDLENLGSSRELVGYFENQALGMSMKYGLKSSLYAAARRFFLVKDTKKIGRDRIYSRLVFITWTGDILIDTLGTPDSFPLFCAHLIGTRERAGQILGNGSQIAVSHPFYFKGEYTGLLVSFINPDAIDRNLVRQAGDTGRFFQMAAGTDPLYLPGKILGQMPGSSRIELSRVPEKTVRIIRPRTGKEPGILAMRAQVPNTPFSIISLAQTEGISGETIFAIGAAFVLFLMAGIFFIWRTATQKLIFGVRLSESRENEKRFRDLVAFLPIPIVEYDFEFRLRYANQEAARFFGYPPEEIKGAKHILEIIPKEYLPMAMERTRVMKSGHNPGPLDLSLNLKNGRTVWGRVIPSIIYEKGEPSGIRTCFMDYTQRRQNEQESIMAAEQEKFALVGQVAGKMAHDFNNILSAIMGNAELTLMDCRDEQISATLEIILEQAKRGNILTGNLVAFAKDQEIKEEYFDINKKIDLVLNLLKKELEGITVIKKLQENPPELMADPGMIEHALVNLVQNAVHAMGKEKNPVLGLETRADKDGLSIIVQDNGCGIPKAYFKEVYSPSFSLKGSRDFAKAYDPDIKGTGYGLSNVKKYIDKHKGRISFESEEGRGTRFVVHLPLVAKTLLPEEKKDLLKKPVKQGKHILVVEDEDAIAWVLKKILTSDPFFHEVTMAKDPESAMALIDRRDRAKFDLVSLDYMLPGRKDGLDVYTHIRSQCTELPVIFISGNLRFLESMKEMKASDPRVDHLSKPFENMVYADKINAWLQ